MLLPPGECVGDADFRTHGRSPAELLSRTLRRKRIVAAEGIDGARQLMRHRVPMCETRDSSQRRENDTRDGHGNRDAANTASESVGSELYHVCNRHRKIVGEIERPPARGLTARGANGSVRDRRCVDERHCRSPTCEEREEARAHYAREPRHQLAVAPPVEHGRTNRGGPQLTGRVRVEYEMLRLAFGTRIVGILVERSERRVLIGGSVSIARAAAVHRDAAGVHEAGLRGGRRIDDRACAIDVGALKSTPASAGGDERGAMKDRVASGHGRAQRLPIENVALGELGSELAQPRRRRCISHQRAHAPPVRDEALGDVRADETCRAGDERATHSRANGSETTCPWVVALSPSTLTVLSSSISRRTMMSAIAPMRGDSALERTSPICLPSSERTAECSCGGSLCPSLSPRR